MADSAGKTALIALRARQAEEHLQTCQLCEHRCGANRRLGQRGPCFAGTESRVFRHRVEVGEEQELIPSHLFYVSGCDLRCSFCIAEAYAFDPSRGTPLTGEFLRAAIDWGRARNARNIQWVGGEPTIHLPAILAAMAQCPILPRVVWKSDFHGSVAAFELLRGIVDIYVADFKFGNEACAQRLAGVGRYHEIVTRNLRVAAQQGDLIVRHLLMPGHLDCCFVPVAEWLQRELPAAKFSIRDGYRPRWRAVHDPLMNRPVTRHEVRQAWNWARSKRMQLVA